MRQLIFHLQSLARRQQNPRSSQSELVGVRPPHGIYRVWTINLVTSYFDEQISARLDVAAITQLLRIVFFKFTNPQSDARSVTKEFLQVRIKK